MKILYIAHRVPYPPDKGEKIRAFKEVQFLARRHDVAVVAFADPEDAVEEARAGLERCGAEVVLVPRQGVRPAAIAKSLWQGEPLTLPYFWNPRLEKAIETLDRKRKFEAAFAYSSAMAQYLDGFEDRLRVADLVDIDSDKWRQYAETTRPPKRWVFRREHRTLRAYEQRIVASFDASLVVTEAERSILPADVRSQVVVAPNGVDSEYFAPPPVRSEKVGDPSVVFTGTMDYLPNVDAVVWFCERILPVVRKEVPDVRFTIAGQRPAKRVRDLAKLSGVRVTGRVPDVRPFLHEAHVAVAPLRVARGVQNKVLEAMAAGLPVVLTPQAAEGLELEEGEVEIQSSEAEFAGAVARLLRDPQRRAEMGRRAREAVVGRYSWERLESVLAALFEDARAAGCRTARAEKARSGGLDAGAPSIAAEDRRR